MLHRLRRRRLFCIIFLRIYKMLLCWFLSWSLLAFLHLVVFSFFSLSFFLVDDHRVRRVNKINSMLLGHVHTLKCIILWLFLPFHFHLGLSTCYDLFTYNARIFIEEAFCAITTCNRIINAEDQKNGRFACELKIKHFSNIIC
jgi:hypothetical protein